MAEELSHEVDVSIVSVHLSFDVHDTFKAVPEETKDVGVIDRTVILNLSLHLHLVLRLFETAWAQDLEDDVPASLVPVLGQVDFSIGALINLLLNLVALINHHSLGLDHRGRGHCSLSWSPCCLVEHLTLLRDGRKFALIPALLSGRTADTGVDRFL